MKKDLGNITKNFSVLMLGQIVYKLFAFLAYVLIARYFGVSEFGRFSFAISYVGLFSVVMDFGLSELLIRDVAGRFKEIGEKYINNIFTVKLILSVIGYLLIIVTSFLFVHTIESRILISIFGLCVVIDSMTLFFRSIFRLFEKMEFEALSVVIEASLKAGVIYSAYKFFKLEIESIAYLFLLISAVSFIITFTITVFKFFRIKFKLDYVMIAGMMQKAIPFCFIAFFGVMNFKVATIMVTILTNDFYTGLFSAATRLIEPVLIIPVVASVALFPVFSRYYRKSREDALKFSRKTLAGLLLGAFIVILLINIVAKTGINFVFGAEYNDSLLVFRLLSFSFIAFFIKFFMERFILILEKPKIIISSYLMGILIMVILGMILVHFIGYTGIAVALVLSELFVVGINYSYIKKHVYKKLIG